MYHPQLAYCIVQFLEKDAALTEEVGFILANLGRYTDKKTPGRPRPSSILAEGQQHKGGHVLE
jgi:hypothetical protein